MDDCDRDGVRVDVGETDGAAEGVVESDALEDGVCVVE